MTFLSRVTAANKGTTITLLLFVLFVGFLWAGDARITVQVQDEQGNPVVGAKVRASWAIGSFADLGASTPGGVDGVSWADGRVTLSVPTVPSIDVRHDLYYFSTLFRDPDLYPLFKNAPFPLLHPTVSMVLKKKKNPVPMFYYHDPMQRGWPIPRLGESLGFDFERGDWVIPHGKGTISDVFVTVDYQFRNEGDWERTVTIKAAGLQDGFILFQSDARRQREEFPFPVEAPEDGYVQSITWKDYMHESPEWLARYRQQGYKFNQVHELHRLGVEFERLAADGDENNNYIFRIRTSLPLLNGGKPKPMYGKIRGPISIDERALKMTYYLNPAGSRSIEFDMKNNLAPGKPNVGWP